MENMGYYEPDDCFICKNGRHLDLSSHYTSLMKDGTERKISVYRCEDCSGCPYRAACCKAKDSEKRKEILVCWEFQNLAQEFVSQHYHRGRKPLRRNRVPFRQRVPSDSAKAQSEFQAFPYRR